MAFPTRRQAAAFIRKQRPYGKVCAAYLEEGTLTAARVAGGGITAVEAIRQLKKDLPKLLAQALNENV